MDNWESLLTTLEIVGEHAFGCEDSEIRLFEEETKITLPDSYKEYCKVFGPGVHNREFTVHGLRHDAGGWDLLNFGNRNLEVLKGSVRIEINHFLEGHPAADHEKMRWLEGLLDHSLPFADNSAAEIFLWDLDSYSPTDQSCDIYRIGIDSLDEACVVGRDFYKFIAEFIYERKIDGVPIEGSNYPEIHTDFLFQ
jgi:hypothetical protein